MVVLWIDGVGKVEKRDCLVLVIVVYRKDCGGLDDGDEVGEG